MNAHGTEQPLSDKEKAELYVDVWKETIEVQKHFNDLEWRIRGLALTAVTFALGASAVAAQDNTTIHGVSLGTVVLAAGLLLWYAFYFADKYWYHPLLIGSVKHGTALEVELRTWLPAVGLTHAISEASPTNPEWYMFWRKKDLHSSDKLRYFYLIGAFVLVVAAVLLQLGATSATSNSAPPHDRGTQAVNPPGT